MIEGEISSSTAGGFSRNKAKIISKKRVLYERHKSSNLDSLDDCPWGPNPVDLSLETLSADQRFWVANALLNRGAKVVDFKKRFNISEDRLRNYREKLYLNEPFQENIGRPKSLDSISIPKIAWALAERPNMPTSELKKLIMNEYLCTKRRRYPSKSDSDFGRMPRSSRFRYLRIFHRENTLDDVVLSNQTTAPPAPAMKEINHEGDDKVDTDNKKARRH